jgi:hypothetical protein
MKKFVVSIIGLSISWAFTQEDHKYHLYNFVQSDPLIAANLALTLFRTRRVMEKMKRVLGDSHPDTLTTYSNQGHWNDAEVLGVVVLVKMTRVRGVDHPSTLTSMANLASSYWKQGRWNDADRKEEVGTKWVLGVDPQ